jgi:hypothetical protein
LASVAGKVVVEVEAAWVVVVVVCFTAVAAVAVLGASCGSSGAMHPVRMAAKARKTRGRMIF